MKNFMLLVTITIIAICSGAAGALAEGVSVAVGGGALPVGNADMLVASPVGESLSAFLTGVIFPVISAFLLGVLTLFINRVSAKYKLDFIKQNEDFLLEVAKRGIAIAEEKSADAVKKNFTSITGRDKLDIATAHILDRVPKLPQDKANALVHAALAQFEGVGANKEKTL